MTLRRLLAVLTLVVLMGGVLCLPASAESAASNIDLVATVNADGDCFVTMTVNLRMEDLRSQLTFPLPPNARNVRMNGSSVATTRSTSSVDVDISRNIRDYMGGVELRFEYTLPKAVQVNRDLDDAAQKTKKNQTKKERELKLTLPMLNGFEFPVESLKFTVTMPSPAKFSPQFTSIYRQESIASDLRVLSSGSQIIGSSITTLNDREGMTMTMTVPKTMFPTVSTYVREGNPELTPMLAFFGLALLYWLLFLFNLPLRPSRTSTPPEGITAGEMGSHLTLAGADLTTMVFTWAQLGYILIHMDGDGRVLLNRRMDMGNERSAFENKVFRLLFGNRRTVDATGNQYAQLCLRVAEMVPSEKVMHRGNSGNMRFFRYLCCVAQVFCGINVAMNLTEHPFLRVLMAVILGAFGAFTAWLIQGIAYRTHLRGKVPVYIGLACVLVWAGLGISAGQVWIPLGGALGQWVAGFFAAYGGRRSDLGRHDAGLILGFRRYVKRLPRENVGRLMSNDPDYFFNLAPYALALGVIRPFGNVFGRRKLDQCPYLVTRISGKRTGDEWARLIAETADKMDAKSRQLQLERLFPAQLPRISIEPAPRRKPKRR